MGEKRNIGWTVEDFFSSRTTLRGRMINETNTVVVQGGKLAWEELYTPSIPVRQTTFASIVGRKKKGNLKIPYSPHSLMPFGSWRWKWDFTFLPTESLHFIIIAPKWGLTGNICSPILETDRTRTERGKSLILAPILFRLSHAGNDLL